MGKDNAADKFSIALYSYKKNGPQKQGSFQERYFV